MTKHMFSKAVLTLLAVISSSVRADDKTDIQGTWKVEKAMEGGKEMEAKKREKIRLEFTNGKAIAHTTEGDHPADYTIDSAKTPKNISIRPKDKDAMDGIYKLEGDTLTICLGGNGRPTDFESKANTKTMLLVLKREKK